MNAYVYLTLPVFGGGPTTYLQVATLNKLLENLTVGNTADVLHLAVSLRCLDSIACQHISHILQPGTSKDHQISRTR